MPNTKSDAGLVRSSASIAHAFVREQLMAILAPVYFFYHRRESLAPARALASQSVCLPTSAIDLQPTGIKRS